MPPRWTADHLVAAVELTCAVVVLAWLSVQAVEDGSVLPFLLGLAAAALLTTWSVRSWRRASRATSGDAQPSASPTGRPSPSPTTPAAPPDAPTPTPEPVAAPHPPPPTLSPDGERELARVVAVLADAGVLAPHTPDHADLRAPVADHGEPVTADAVLAALDEADYYVPGFDRSACTANLAFHASHTEQFAETLRDQVDDLARLAGRPATAVFELTEHPGSAAVATQVRLTVDGQEQLLAYDGAANNLSTVLHVAVASTLRERHTERRLAWLWSDQGVWLSALPDGTVERLNAVLGAAAGEGWEWVDEQAPTAAGEGY